MVRLAAIGDLHIRSGVPAALAESLAAVHLRADALVVAGDITDGGRLVEAEQAAELFRLVAIPVVAVLGNHDRRSLRRTAFRRTLERAGVTLLDGGAVTYQIGGRIGFAGVAGCGGGFWPPDGPTALPSRALRAVSVKVRLEAARLDAALAGLDTDATVVVMHFSPTTSTLGSEPVAKYWMLGNGELGRVIDRHRVDLVIHGHAHLGNAAGRTAGGVPVRNVATSVTGGVSWHEVDNQVERRPVGPAWAVVGRGA